MDEGHEVQMQEQIGEIQKQLAVISSLPSLNTEQVTAIGGRLGVIYDEAEKRGDAALMATVSDTWVVLQANSTTTAIATSALTGLIEAVQQRDSVLDELGRIEDGISELESKGETSNPRLRGAAHVMYETLRERWIDEEGEAWINMACPGCQAVRNDWDIDQHHDPVNVLYAVLFLGQADSLPADLRQELSEFLVQWGSKAASFIELVTEDIA
jgi:hypothetical protein